MSEQRRVMAEVEVAATPEQAWEAIATGPGITAWFMPAEVEGRVGGAVVHRHDGVTPSPGTVTRYEAPRRFAYEEPSPLADEVPGSGPIATEFLVEARSGGTCVVRVVMSGFGEGDAWDRAIDSFAAGWRQVLLSLRLYLERFRGEPVAAATAGVTVAGAPGAVWSELIGALGLPPAPRVGDRVATAAGAPSMTGRVEGAGDAALTLLLERPAPGVGILAVGGPGEDVYVVARAQLFGPGAAEAAARAEDEWRAWLARLPAPA